MSIISTKIKSFLSGMKNALSQESPCSFCGKMVLQANKDIHEARCENMLKKQPANNYLYQQFKAPLQGLSRIQSVKCCSICNEKFEQQDQLDAHFQTCFQMNQSFICQVCNETFPQFLMDEHKNVCGQGDQMQGMNNFNQQYNQIIANKGIEDDQGGRLNPIQIRDNRQLENEDDFEDVDENFQDEQNQNQENINDDNEEEEEDYDDYNEESKQNLYSEDQINSILDRGGLLPQFEDHDLSNTGGLNNQQIEVFPVQKFYPEQNKNLCQDQISCSICLDEFQRFQFLKTLGCLHRFHKKCINHWLIKNRLCPICKVDQKQFV